MFDSFIKTVFANAVQEVERRREQETNALMAEIEGFHKEQAIDKALATNDKEAFLILTEGV